MKKKLLYKGELAEVYETQEEFFDWCPQWLFAFLVGFGVVAAIGLAILALNYLSLVFVTFKTFFLLLLLIVTIVATSLLVGYLVCEAFDLHVDRFRKKDEEIKGSFIEDGLPDITDSIRGYEIWD